MINFLPIGFELSLPSKKWENHYGFSVYFNRDWTVKVVLSWPVMNERLYVWRASSPLKIEIGK